MIARHQGEVRTAAAAVTLPDDTPLPGLARCRYWCGGERRRESAQRAAVEAGTRTVGWITAEWLGKIFLWIAGEVGIEIPAGDAVDSIASGGARCACYAICARWS